MKYQLVVQWPAFSMQDYDAMIEVEDLFMEELTSSNEVDGHDVGAEEVNIFVRTDNPQATFDELKNILHGSIYWTDVRVAYRELAKTEYTILWPQSLRKFEVK
jgi:hypothetical protein